MSNVSLYYDELVNNQTLAAIYCSLNSADTCLGICPNTDLAGIGVRASFYIQSIFNVLLIKFSPEDSASGSWAAVLLTASLVIPAAIQKYQGQLTLFHATLVLNYATLSTVASLAIAPRCTVWRAKDRPSEVQKEEHGRILLSFSILVQVVLQWFWAVLLFTSPQYAQPWCNGDTILMLFGIPIMAQDIDPHLRPNATSLLGTGEVSDTGASYFWVWPLWLLFCVGVVLAYAIVLVLTSSSAAHPAPSPSHHSVANTNRLFNTPVYRPGTRSVRGQSRSRSRSYSPSRRGLKERTYHWSRSMRSCLRHLRLPKDPAKRWLVSNYFWASLIFVFFVIITEVQHQLNWLLLPGENSFVGGFGQCAALLFAFAPVWSLFMAWFKGDEEGEHKFLPLYGHIQHDEERDRSRRRRSGLHRLATQLPSEGNGGSPLTQASPTSAVASHAYTSPFRRERSRRHWTGPPLPPLQRQETFEVDLGFAAADMDDTGFESIPLRISDSSSDSSRSCDEE